MTPENEYLERECVIIKWFHRQLVSRYSLVSFTPLISFQNQDPAASSLDCFREGMVQTLGQIYEQRIFPKYTIPYFSDNFHAEETWLSSVTFPPLDHSLQKKFLPSDNSIPPYNIQHGGPYDDLFGSDRMKSSSKITAIMEELSSINRIQCYTYFLEYYLLAYARHFYRFIDQDYPTRGFHDDGGSLKYFAQWFSYAHPNTKILVGLWTSCYLLRRVQSKWYPPVGFCSGAISFLEVRF